MSPTFSDSVRERFEKHVDRSSEDGCWPWLLKPDPQGYGQINIGDKKVMRAHRVSYLLNVGEIPEGDWVVMHKCDNRICVRPDHLVLGSRADNLADCRAKGRWSNKKRLENPRRGQRGPSPRPIPERFAAKVPQGAPDECWPYNGTKDPHGYGRFYVSGGPNAYKPFAHRVAYQIAFGEIPDGMVVMHTCDNPPCCNPAHLRLGTLADNNRDRSEKGRGRENRQWGSDNPGARLTWDLVREIRRLYAEGVSQGKLAKQFGVNQPQISRIVRNLSWPQE